jgi:hypothetical protein
MNPCPGGCVWANSAATLCSTCAIGEAELIRDPFFDDELEDPEMLAACAELDALEDDGLCSNYGRSRWIQAAKARVIDPAAIAAELNSQDRGLCDHHQTVCMARCGVQRVDYVWSAVPAARRMAWFDKMLSLESRRR